MFTPFAGMFQRLDRMRKNAFGSMVLFGADYKSQIAGLWCWRGQDLAFKVGLPHFHRTLSINQT